MCRCVLCGEWGYGDLLPEEIALDQARRGRTDDHTAQGGELLEPGGQSGGLANGQQRLPVTPQRAHHRGSRMDPHAHCTRTRGKLRRPLPQGVHQPQPGPDAALGIIVVRLRIAKIGHHGVTEILPNHSLQPVDDLGTGSVEGPHQGLDLFQVAVGSPRVDQRAPEHCQERRSAAGASR